MNFWIKCGFLPQRAKCQIIINFIFDSYGLLGASGCGKTTVLSAIVGLKSIDDGVITVFNGTPGDRKNGIPGKRVGYMPQDVALYGEFKIKETLQYFGRIHGLTQAQIEAKMKSLTEFLELPDANTLIRNLSGGQQRRVSFAVALLHDPELLILDEPTVGVDPMLRQKIWNHLMQLVMFNFWSISCSFCTLGGASKFFVVKQSSLCSHFAKHLISTDF